MAKITLNDVDSGLNQKTIINSNNDTVETEFNNKVLYRNNPAGEANQMENLIDMNSNRIVNLLAPASESEVATKAYVDDVATGAIPAATTLIPNTATYNVGVGGANLASHTGATAGSGFKIVTNYFDTNLTLGSGSEAGFTDTTAAGKAGNWPNADGFFYDADGKQFAVIGSPVDVKWFGGGVSAATDSSLAVRTAIASLGANGGWIHFSAGDYYIPTTVTATVPLKVTGDGNSQKNSIGVSKLFTDGSNFIFTITPSPADLSYEFSSLLFQDTGTTSAGGIHFTTNSARHLFSMCSFKEFKVGSGIKLQTAIIYTALSCNFESCLIGIESTSSTGVIVGGQFANPAAVSNTIGISHKTSNQIFVDTAYFDDLETGVKLEDVAACQIKGRFESCGGGIHIIDGDNNILQGSFFSGMVDFHIKLEHDDAAFPPTNNVIGPNKHASSGLSETEIVFDDTWERDITIFEPTLEIMTYNVAGASEAPRWVVRKNERATGVAAGFEAYSSTSTTDPTDNPVRGSLLAEWAGSSESACRVGSVTNHKTKIIRNDVNVLEIDLLDAVRVKAGPFVLETVTALDDTGTPTVAAGNLFKSGGTTAITDFDDGVVGQTIRLLAAHSVTITDGTPIILNGGANFTMVATDTLTLTMFNDQVWQEVGRSVN